MIFNWPLLTHYDLFGQNFSSKLSPEIFQSANILFESRMCVPYSVSILTPRLSVGTQESNLVWVTFQRTFYSQQVLKWHQRQIVKVNTFIVKMAVKSFENSFLKNGILEFWSEALVVYIWNYCLTPWLRGRATFGPPVS